MLTSGQFSCFQHLPEHLLDPQMCVQIPDLLQDPGSLHHFQTHRYLRVMLHPLNAYKVFGLAHASARNVGPKPADWCSSAALETWFSGTSLSTLAKTKSILSLWFSIHVAFPPLFAQSRHFPLPVQDQTCVFFSLLSRCLFSSKQIL